MFIVLKPDNFQIDLTLHNSLDNCGQLTKLQKKQNNENKMKKQTM